jgi:hypothetical protein
MQLLKRADVPAPNAPAREVVNVPALGGAVVVVEMMLAERLAFDDMLRTLNEPDPAEAGAAPADAAPKPRRARKPGPRAALHAAIPHLLAATVLIDGDEPLYTPDEWGAFGARHKEAAIELFNVAARLSGFNDGEAAKN